MAYADFDLERVEANFGLTARFKNLFPQIEEVGVPEWLDHLLRNNRQVVAISSEKSRSEFIVAPILSAARMFAEGSFAIFSGQRLDVEPSRSLVGECDFIVALTEPVPRIKAPLLTVVEAKRGEIELGLGQCAAQMVAARMFNEKAGQVGKPIFGCITTGEDWQFLQLDDDSIYLDEQRLYLNRLGLILATLRAIILAGARA